MSETGGPLIGGRYRILRPLGAGGMGTVYRARDERLQREVAIKLLRVSDDPKQEERFTQEARFLAGLQHPNLVAAYDAGSDRHEGAAVVWLVMELVVGPDLGSLLDRRGRMPSEQVRRLVGDLAAALSALAATGMVHRDLKPANVLLTAVPGEAPWSAKVADLGIAQLLEADRMTTTGQVLGTAAYLSPEQVTGDLVGTGSDVYSLGLIALEALTGERAFPGGFAESAAARVVRPPTLPDWITGGWRMLLEAMTAMDPALRPSAAQVASAVADPLPELVPTDLPPERGAWIDEVTMAAGPATLAYAAEPLAAVEDDGTTVLPAFPALLDEEPRTEAPLPEPDARPSRRTVAVLAGVVTAVAVVGGSIGLLAAGSAVPAATPSPSASPTAAAVVRSSPTATATPTPRPVVRRTTPTPVVTPAPKRIVVQPVAPKKRWNKGKGRGNDQGDDG
ncbi:protein kinase [Amnibacterium sp. CER49]|uniref:serine/threonine-protein kinase n=1 Tax=Amnibacterium sp. CER49 TaxID=3039161 RepID=UPI00244CCF28|nr:serine/threonine-protein kinase [Amnibacterium sp. CER49]MDH2443595.1 protein kinase [Amnibacterium sp. CER49]